MIARIEGENGYANNIVSSDISVRECSDSFPKFVAKDADLCRRS